MVLEPAELARWARFAAKGGIGKCTATCDCVAESPDDLMFLKDDEITVLLQLQDKEGCYLGYCEGVVGRFSASDVAFHSKLKKPVMTKRASTNTTLSVHSMSNIPYSPTPVTPTTPTSLENSATRPSSRKVVDELPTVGGGRSSSQNSVAHVFSNNSTSSSPIPGSQASLNIGARNTSQDTKRTGALHYGTTSLREFHQGITVSDDDVSKEDSPVEPHSPQIDVFMKEMTSNLSSMILNSIILTSPSTPPPVRLEQEQLQPSSPDGREDIPASLLPPGSLINDHDPAEPTAPLRITKRSHSAATSPAQSTFSPPAIDSAPDPLTASSNNVSARNGSFDLSLATAHLFGDMVREAEQVTKSSPTLLDLHMPSEADRDDQVPALPSFLDTSVTAESVFDDLTTSHPGRFSRFSMGDALTIPQPLNMTSQNAPIPQPVSVKNEPQEKPATNSPQASIPSKPDGRTSLSIAARGKVDEATLASTQAQVGIGLSLLQDLVGGMSSDSDSDYGDSDEPTEEAQGFSVQAGRTLRGTVNGHLNGSIRNVNSTRSSVTPSEGSTVQGLTYADEEIESQTSTTKNDTKKETTSLANVNANYPASPTLRSPPKTPPVRHQSPRALSRYTQHQSPESFTLPDVLDRERRPSLATSVVSGLSRKSGTSSSWDADIYDNYRYSTFSAGSSMTGAGRPSMDSVRPRTDSVSVAGRMWAESIDPILDVDETKSDLAGLENQSSFVDTDASFYSQGSRLSALSRVVTSPGPGDSVSAQLVNRPVPLSISAIEDHSPLLHTDWVSPFSPASTVQTALPPLTASPHTPHLRQNGAAGVPEMRTSALSQAGTVTAEGGEQELDGMASTIRKRLEDERQSPTLNETQHSSEMEEIEPNDNNVSFTSAGLGQAIVVDDDEELPSRIFATDESDLYDNDGMDSHYSHGTGSADLESKSVEIHVTQDENRPGPQSPSPRTSFGHLASLFVSNRTPSPAMLDKDDEDVTQASSNSTEPGVPNSLPKRAQSPVSQQSQLPTQPHPSSEPNISHQRPRNNAAAQERRSLFLPHPNAPKAPANASLNLEPGAGIGVVSTAYPTLLGDSQSRDVPPVPSPHMRPPVQVVIRMALSIPPRTTLIGPGKTPVQILPTIYGRTEVDLASSDRPVPIIFSVDPPPFNGGGKATAPHGAVLPPIGAGGSKLIGGLVSGATNYQGSPPRRPSTTQAITDRGSSLPINPGIVPRVTSSSLPQASLATESRDTNTVDNSVTQKRETAIDTANLKISSPKGSSPLLRPNFTPKSPGIRPRSRSFSGFNSSDSRGAPALSSGETKESINNLPKRTSSSSALALPGLKRLAKPLRPSPLSVDDASKPPHSPAIPTSPLARNVFVPSPPPSATIAAPSSPVTGYMDRASSNAKASRSTLAEANQIGNSSIGKPPFDGITRQTPLPAAIGVARQSSLRSKLSLPNLRRNRTRDEDTGVYDRDAKDRPKEMMQVKDMEFELIRPNVSVLQAQQRTSEDSMIGRPDTVSESRVDHGLLRSESPAVSFISSDYRSPVVDMRNSVNGPGPNLDTGMTSLGQSTESMEAHRQRETKWVSLMSSSPASLSRKSKKVRKLLVDGVPSSVRYLIWSYLTDGKGRAVKGVYEQLCRRGEVLRTRDIVADMERLFAGNDRMQYLHATKGAIVVLLQAYFSMVPDVQYTTGLTKIVGQLLLLAPEEDAFWIFTSIMDTHIRPYFTVIAASASTPSPRSTQMEVDAALYSRALEAIDPPLAKKIFVDLGILPGALCHPWFTSLFVGTLPPECIDRIWDIFLYDGIPFLLRVALSLTIICRKFILSPTTTSETTVLATLARPPHQWLPPTPEACLTLAFNVKLKDDDIRKQRTKMGEQVKRQTQAQQALSSVTPTGISLPSFSRV